MHLGRHPPGQTYPSMHLGRHPPGQTYASMHWGRYPRRPLQRTVRILLECILVANFVSSYICSFLLYLDYMISGGSKGGTLSACPLLTDQNFPNFMQFLGKYGKFVCWRPLPRGILDPSLMMLVYINLYVRRCILIILQDYTYFGLVSF